MNANYISVNHVTKDIIEDIILTHSSRGMDLVRDAIPRGFCHRAAQLVLDNRGIVLIGTGFPVGGSFETDGPIGAIGLYQVLEQLGYQPVFVCEPPLSQALKNDYSTYEIPILGWQASIPAVVSALERLNPALIISIERPGIARNGRYHNMRKQDITDLVAKCDLFFELCTCPTLAFGDGGNEMGMGNINGALSRLPIIPSVTTCDELVIATVSNWGIYGMLAAMSHTLEQDLFTLFDPRAILEYLITRGSVDGVTKRPEHSEDGFPIEVGLSLISRLRETFQSNGATVQ